MIILSINHDIHYYVIKWLIMYSDKYHKYSQTITSYLKALKIPVLDSS